jgi:hypothetical protein
VFVIRSPIFVPYFISEPLFSNIKREDDSDSEDEDFGGVEKKMVFYLLPPYLLLAVCLFLFRSQRAAHCQLREADTGIYL